MLVFGGGHSLVILRCHISFHLGLHGFPPGERGEFRHGTKGGFDLGLGRLGSAVPGGRALPTEEWWKTAGGESWPLGKLKGWVVLRDVWCYQKTGEFWSLVSLESIAKATFLKHKADISKNTKLSKLLMSTSPFGGAPSGWPAKGTIQDVVPRL